MPVRVSEKDKQQQRFECFSVSFKRNLLYRETPQSQCYNLIKIDAIRANKSLLWINKGIEGIDLVLADALLIVPLH